VLLLQSLVRQFIVLVAVVVVGILALRPTFQAVRVAKVVAATVLGLATPKQQMEQPTLAVAAVVLVVAQVVVVDFQLVSKAVQES
jgi:hypothetical protein